ncbi:MAG: methylated-DNA--[protein]-cysteine S-methyltransferase [Alphaproteobacteria bacterium]|jgi:methylated-DNA-[protein]-cysteine S-methyltransferase
MVSARKPGFTNQGPVSRLTVTSPVGNLTLFEAGGKITGLTWAAGKGLRNAKPTPVLAEARDQITAYFKGELKKFSLPIAPDGTQFQRGVWQGLSNISFGKTLSYGELAKKISSSPRAVGGACGANPIPIIIPCHRVLGANGTLHGYSGHGGIETKALLLRLEDAPVNG